MLLWSVSLVCAKRFFHQIGQGKCKNFEIQLFSNQDSHYFLFRPLIIKAQGMRFHPSLATTELVSEFCLLNNVPVAVIRCERRDCVMWKCSGSEWVGAGNVGLFCMLISLFYFNVFHFCSIYSIFINNSTQLKSNCNL